MTLADAPLHARVIVTGMGGERLFRRRLMELGLVPGTAVMVDKIAPLGDLISLKARGCTLSIRGAEAQTVRVRQHCGPSRVSRAEQADVATCRHA